MTNNIKDVKALTPADMQEEELIAEMIEEETTANKAVGAISDMNGTKSVAQDEHAIDDEVEEDLPADNKILVFGIGYFTSHFIQELSSEYHCTVVDPEAEKSKERWADNKNITLFAGDVNSILLWKKLPLTDVSHIVLSIAALHDIDVAAEVCRLAREMFKLDIPIICFVGRGELPDFLEQYNITHVNPVAVGVSAAKMLIAHNYATPSNIGLGEGEMVEVTIVRRSHLIGRKLRYMESSRWKVAAIYRDGELKLPDGESMLEVGDKVVLVGDPKMLENMVNILMQGIPQFPTQYGQYMNVVVGDEGIGSIEETNYFKRNLRSRGLKIFTTAQHHDRISKDMIVQSMKPQIMPKLPMYRDKSIFTDAGTVVVQAPDKFTFINRRIPYFIKKCPVPLLVSKGKFPYSSIVPILNSPNPSQVIEVAIELSNLLSLPIKTIFVSAPKDLRNAKQDQEMQSRLKLIKEYESIERITLDCMHLEGNPVKEVLKYQQDNQRSLYIIGNDRGQAMMSFTPHIPYLLVKRLSSSLLIVPEIE